MDEPWLRMTTEGEYALYVYRLQSRCGLTFKEAIGVLSPPAYTKQISEYWGITEEAVINARRRGWRKIRLEVGEDNWDAMDELAPTHFWHIF